MNFKMGSPIWGPVWTHSANLAHFSSTQPKLNTRGPQLDTLSGIVKLGNIFHVVCFLFCPCCYPTQTQFLVEYGLNCIYLKTVVTMVILV